MDFKESQKDMRLSYANGATGALVSGVIWCLAGVVGIAFSKTASMLTLFFGGTLIFPLSVVLSKLLNRSGKHDPDNALRHLAFENLGILFAGLFIAFLIARFNSSLFFPIMLLIIGVRYLTFQTIYGLKIYWALGLALVAAGFLLMIIAAPFSAGAFAGGMIEIVFSLAIFKQAKTTEILTNIK